MTRLDSVIRRLKAQRDCLNWAAAQISPLPGPVFELGLGNGRTFDHLRSRLPNRDIYVFERQVAAHPDCIPDDEHLFIGDLRQTLPQVARRFAGQAVLAHCDLGSGDEDRDRQLSEFLAGPLARLMAPGGLLVSDQPILLAHSEPLALPEAVPEGRYFIRRFHGGAGQ